MSTNDQSLLPFNCDAYCKTDVLESEKFTFVWEISKFSARREVTGTAFLSKEFTIQGPGSMSSKWCGKVYPHGRESDYKDYISVYLMNNNDKDIIVQGAIMTMDSNKKIGKTNICKMNMQKIKVNNGWGNESFIERTDEIEKFAPNDTLTLVFEVIVTGEVEESFEVLNNRNKSKALDKIFHHERMSHDIGLLLTNKDFADVTITCGKQKFECHKNILGSRSAVFKAMFTSKMKEHNMGSVEIKDMDPIVLENLLQYIYTCKAPDIDTLTRELFSAADQYQLEELKELSEVKLSSRIEVKNCIEFLLLGDLYQATILKAEALRFVSQNINKINISECKKALISNPTLLFEVMEMMIPKGNDRKEANLEKKRAAIS